MIFTTSITRPANTTAYAANDAWSDSTSAPTSGGFTFSGLVGGGGVSYEISDLVVISSNDPATTLQGELWFFDASVTNINDNDAFALSDADALKLVGVVPFTLNTSVAGSGTNSLAHVIDLDIGFTPTTGTGLYYLVKVKNAYTPASGEVLTVRLKVRRA